MRRKPILLAAALAAAAVPAVMATSASAAVTPAWSTYFMAGGTAPVTGIKVSGYTGKSVYVAVATTASGAVLRVSNTAGTAPPPRYTAANAYSGTSVQFVGTQDQVNAALASLAISLPASTNSKVILRTTAFENRDGVAYFPQDQHFYKFVAKQITATAAFSEVDGSTEYGQKGYLASITSQAENDFVSEKISGSGGGDVRNVWIGATDEGPVDGKWIWRGGPDNGQQFWSGCNVANGGAPYEGRFSSWADGEPNNWGSGGVACPTAPVTPEDCAATNKYIPAPAAGAGFFPGKWNDISCGSNTIQGQPIGGYIAEYGNLATGGSFTNVDIVDSTMNVAVPANKPTFLDTLFRTILGPKKSKVPVPKKISKAAQAKAAKKAAKETRLKYNLVFQNGGRFSFYLTNQSTNKLIPIAAGSSIAGRKLTKDYSVPVIRDIKANQSVRVVLDANTKKLAKGALLNVILQEKQADGSFKLYRQDAPDPPLVKVG